MDQYTSRIFQINAVNEELEKMAVGQAGGLAWLFLLVQSTLPCSAMEIAANKSYGLLGNINRAMPKLQSGIRIRYLQVRISHPEY